MTELVVPSLDFSPLGELGQVYNQARDAASQKRTLAQLGQGGDDADILLKSGNMNLIQLGQQMRNRQNDMMLKQQEIERAQGNSDRDYGLRVRAQNRADEGPGVAVAQRAKVAEQYGLKPGTPEHTQYVLGGTVPQTSSNSITAQVEQRKQAAASLGMNPDHPAYQSFVATGKMPREDAQPLTATDKKAILEADEAVQSNKAVIGALDEAKKISPDTYTGVGASTRAKVGNMLPDWMVPDAVASPKAAGATANYENLVLGQALGQLKSIFGAAPTEGERKILLELQASVDKPDNVRQEILGRARMLAENRLKFNEQRANELRGGTFYKKGGGAQSAPTQQPNQSGDPLAAARDAIARGADPAAVKQRLLQNGIDPSGL